MRNDGVCLAYITLSHRWTSRIDKDAREKQKQQIFDAWLACHTQQAIADVVGWPQKTVSHFLDGFSKNGQVSDFAKTSENPESDEDSPFTLSDAQRAASEHNDGTNDEGKSRWSRNSSPYRCQNLGPLLITGKPPFTQDSFDAS